MFKELLGFFGHIQIGPYTYWVDSFKEKEHIRSCSQNIRIINKTYP